MGKVSWSLALPPSLSGLTDEMTDDCFSVLHGLHLANNRRMEASEIPFLSPCAELA